MAVDVNKIKCNFVNEVVKYIACGKYSIDCCSTKALKAWMNYKLAVFTDCDIPVDATCYLTELDLTDYVVDCSAAVSLLDCDNQISLSLSKVVESCTINSVLANPNNGSQFPVVTVLNDASYPVASINLVTTSSCGESNTHLIESGSYLVSGTPVVNEEFNPHVRVSIDILNVAGNAGGFVNYMWVYETLNATTINPVRILINLDPTTSPYLSCGGCTVVNPAELYFDHPNFVNALQTAIRNAMLTLYGDADLGDFRVEAIGNNYRVSSLAKHNPADIWVGFAKLQSWINYYTGATIADTGASNTILTEYTGFSQVVYNMPLLTCTTLPLTIQGPASMMINWGLTDMHQIVLASPNGTSPWTINSVSTAICPKTTLTATTLVQNDIASQEWLDPGSGYISSDLSIVVEDVGTYTFNIELDNGCSASDTITV